MNQPFPVTNTGAMHIVSLGWVIHGNLPRPVKSQTEAVYTNGFQGCPGQWLWVTALSDALTINIE